MSLVFRPVSVAGGPRIEVCLRLDVGDKVAPWLMEHDWIDEPVQRAFLEQVRPGMRVLDLGSHLGLFGLSAAALGAKVIAVDAVADHAEQLERAVERNGFADFSIVSGVLAERSGRHVRFLAEGIESHTIAEVEDDDDAFDAVTVSVDDILDEHGWDEVDVIKMDIEGSEIAALAGMRRLFARGVRPVFVFEGNGGTLPRYAHSLGKLRSAFTRRGYRLLMIDHLRPGTLVEPQRMQPESVVDYLALPEGHDPPPGWALAPPFTREELVTRLLDEASVDGWAFRRYVSDALHGAPAWLLGDPLMAAGHRALLEDLDGTVRAATPRPAATRASPRREPADPTLVILAREVALATRRERLARVAGQPRERPPRLLLQDVSFHVRRGTLVAVVGSGHDERRALMDALAGRRDVTDGELRVSARPLLLGRLADALEPELSFAENVAILSAFLGRGRRSPHEVALRLGVGAAVDAPLGELAADIALCLVLVLALEVADHELVLLDGLPQAQDTRVRDWAWSRTHALREAGVTIVQAAESPDGLIGPPDRLLYLHDGTLRAAGHVGSVADLARRHQLGLPDRVAASRRSWTRSRA